MPTRNILLLSVCLCTLNLMTLAVPINRLPATQPQLREALSLTQVEIVHQMGFTGKGVAILVVDFFAQKREHHGQMVSEVLYAVAPDAVIVPLDLDEPGTINQKLERILRDYPNIRVANFSWGMEWEERPITFDSYCSDWMAANERAIYEITQKLRAQGIVLVAAAGNAGNAHALSAPACMREFISVGATYDQERREDVVCGETPRTEQPQTDRVACFSNSGHILDLLAPGYLLSLTHENAAGTSFAAPIVASIVALLLEANPHFTAEEVRQLLKSTGKPIRDGRNGIVIPRVDALAALQKSLDLSAPPKPPSNAVAYFFDQNSNLQIEDSEILTALEAWTERLTLSVLGRPLSDVEMLELISLWARASPIE